MRIGIVYPVATDPFKALPAMNVIRWWAIAKGFLKLGYQVDLIASNDCPAKDISSGLRVMNIKDVRWPDYDILKTCYQPAISLTPDHPFIISRIAHFMSEGEPKRFKRWFAEYEPYQELINKKAALISFTNPGYIERWRRRFPNSGAIPVIVPTGSPEEIPVVSRDPFPPGKRVLYVCNITSHHFVIKINEIARRLQRHNIKVYFIGMLNFGVVDIETELSPVIENLGVINSDDIWPYIHHADVGLSFACTQNDYENESSKIYYYLRAGLPVVAEEHLPNAHVVTDSGGGEVFQYYDFDDLEDKILKTIETPPQRQRIAGYMLANHTWSKRVAVYHKEIQKLQVLKH